MQRKRFRLNQKVLLYDSRLHLFPGKLKSRWTILFVVRTIFPHGAVEIENPMDASNFKVNGHVLKPILELPSNQEEELMILHEPSYV